MPIIAVCPLHGPFRSRGMNLSHARGLQFHDVGEICPVPGCRRNAPMMEGTFDLDGPDRVVVREAPEWTIDALKQIGAQFEDARQYLNDPTVTSANALQRLEITLARIEAQGNQNAQQIVDLTRAAVASGATPRAKRRKATIAIGAVLALLTQYGGVRSGIEYVVSDYQAVVQQLQQQDPGARPSPTPQSPPTPH